MICVTGNMRADKTVKLGVNQDKLVWAAQGAKTIDGFDAAMALLANSNEPAAAYLRAIPPANWALHPHYCATPLYGWRTTNFVESEQARSLKLKPRLMLPYDFFRAYGSILMTEGFDRLQQMDEWTKERRIATPRIESKFHSELSNTTCFRVAFSSNSVAFVSHI